MSDKPFLVVSYSIPERASGTPVVIRKFLENFRADEVVLIGRPAGKKGRISDNSFLHPAYIIPTPSVGTRGEKLWRLLSIFMGIFIGLRAIRVYQPRLILAFSPDESSLLTGYLLHRSSGLPLYPYFCDLYRENFPKGIYGMLAAWLQPRIFSSSQRVIVLTEAMKDYYKEKYQIDPVVLPHCNNQTVQKTSFEIKRTGPFKIGFLGNIDIDRIPSLRILCEAINENEKYFLTYYSPQSEDYLIQKGLKIPNSEITFISSNELLISELRKCDVLFLPVINSDDHQERELQAITGFPTKAIEYLICQKPILVHSKPNYFVTRFFRTNHCGFVVTGDKNDLYAALEELRYDANLRNDLVSNAFSIVSLYFNGAVIAERFRDLTNLSK
jgi:glycosyltransferase involved in cell wall biosynthesis